MAHGDRTEVVLIIGSLELSNITKIGQRWREALGVGFGCGGLLGGIGGGIVTREIGGLVRG
jgi:hypothetical protein